MIGSSVIMMAWIAIYSLFQSIDFIDEVVILFGEFTFWAAVLISVIIALGMSYESFVFSSPHVSSRSSLLDKVHLEYILPSGQGHCARDVAQGRPQGPARYRT